MTDQNQPITSLPIKTASGMAATDYLLGIDSAEGYQMLVQDLGDYIIQNALSSLAGESQTLASVISSLNNKTYSLEGGIEIPNNADLNTTDFVLPGNYICSSSSKTPNLVNCPFTTSVAFTLKVESSTGTKAPSISTAWTSIRRTITAHNDPNNVYVQYCYNGNGSAWTYSDWVKLPTRDEITALNSKITVITLPLTNVASSNDIYALYDAHSNGESFRQKIAIAASFGGLPPGNHVLEGYRNSANYGWLRLYTYGVPYATVYSNVKSSGAWSGWKLVPTRDEVDTLNSKTYAKYCTGGTVSGTKYAPLAISATVDFNDGSATLDISSIVTAAGAADIAGIGFASLNASNVYVINSCQVSNNAKTVTMTARKISDGTAMTATGTAVKILLFIAVG